MNIRNCRHCGRIFNYVAGAITCPSCREKMEEKFQEVKEYIRDHRGVGIPEVSEVCDVDASLIRQWLREERLEVTEDSAIFLNCEVCGAPIRCGRFCDKCKGKMTKDLNSAMNTTTPPSTPMKKQEVESGSRMRFL